MQTDRHAHLVTKKCTACKEVKDFSEFGSHRKMRDGKQARCKPCTREASLKYKRSSRKGLALRQWQVDNPGLKRCPLCNIVKAFVYFPRASGRKFGIGGHCRDCKGRQRIARYRADPVREKAKAREWRKGNRAAKAADLAEYRARKLRATVPWADTARIREMYQVADFLTRNSGVDHQVDHIFPLRGATVSGLHVETNLQILTKTENLEKSNRLPSSG